MDVLALELDELSIQDSDDVELAAFIQDFEFTEPDHITNAAIFENPYLSDLMMSNRLHLLKPRKVQAAYKNNGKYGLFSLFLSKSWMNTMRVWMNERLYDKGIKQINDVKFRAYIGLELATSLVSYNDIKQY